MSKAEMLAQLRKMLHELFVARTKGASHPRMTRAQGYVDGYMRALLESRVATNEELLVLVAEQRAIVSGPAVAAMNAEPAT